MLISCVAVRLLVCYMLRTGMLHLVRVTCYLVGGGGGGGVLLLLPYHTIPESDQTRSDQFIPDQTRLDKLTELTS